MLLCFYYCIPNSNIHSKSKSYGRMECGHGVYGIYIEIEWSWISLSNFPTQLQRSMHWGLSYIMEWMDQYLSHFPKTETKKNWNLVLCVLCPLSHSTSFTTHSPQTVRRRESICCLMSYGHFLHLCLGGWVCRLSVNEIGLLFWFIRTLIGLLQLA